MIGRSFSIVVVCALLIACVLAAVALQGSRCTQPAVKEYALTAPRAEIIELARNLLVRADIRILKSDNTTNSLFFRARQCDADRLHQGLSDSLRPDETQKTVVEETKGGIDGADRLWLDYPSIRWPRSRTPPELDDPAMGVVDDVTKVWGDVGGWSLSAFAIYNVPTPFRSSRLLSEQTAVGKIFEFSLPDRKGVAAIPREIVRYTDGHAWHAMTTEGAAFVSFRKQGDEVELIFKFGSAFFVAHRIDPTRYLIAEFRRGEIAPSPQDSPSEPRRSDARGMWQQSSAITVPRGDWHTSLSPSFVGTAKAQLASTPQAVPTNTNAPTSAIGSNRPRCAFNAPGFSDYAEEPNTVHLNLFLLIAAAGANDPKAVESSQTLMKTELERLNLAIKGGGVTFDGKPVGVRVVDKQGAQFSTTADTAEKDLIAYHRRGLDWIRQSDAEAPADVVIDAVVRRAPCLREADVVVLVYRAPIQEGEKGDCGFAFTDLAHAPGDGIIVPKRFVALNNACLTDTAFELAHELGHVLGGDHNNPELDGEVRQQGQPRNRAWIGANPLPGSKQIATVLASLRECRYGKDTSAGCRRVERFSSPKETYGYEGKIVGDDDHDNLSVIKQGIAAAIRSRKDSTAIFDVPAGMPPPPQARPQRCVHQTYARFYFQPRGTVEQPALTEGRSIRGIGEVLKACPMLGLSIAVSTDGIEARRGSRKIVRDRFRRARRLLKEVGVPDDIIRKARHQEIFPSSSESFDLEERRRALARRTEVSIDSCGSKKVVLVYYETKADTPLPEGVVSLERLIPEAIACTRKGGRIHCEGHADERGTQDYNNDLSERRARNACARLAAGAISDKAVTVTRKGEDQAFLGDQYVEALQRRRYLSFETVEFKSATRGAR